MRRKIRWKRVWSGGKERGKKKTKKRFMNVVREEMQMVDVTTEEARNRWRGP